MQHKTGWHPVNKITVAAVSTKNWIGEQDRAIRNMAKWARRASEFDPDLIVFPELGVSGYVHHTVSWDLAEPVPGPSTDRLIRLADEIGTVLCFGVLERDADVVYNTQVLVNGQGIIGKQRKIHMPHVEYLYWRGGFEARSFDIGKAKVGILICYDALFSELARTLYFAGSEVLIMPFAYNPTIPRARFDGRRHYRPHLSYDLPFQWMLWNCMQ
jgi:predicted amidohydrolase